jgi:hypothetical protein
MQPPRAKHSAATAAAGWLCGEGAGWAGRLPLFTGATRITVICAVRVELDQFASEVAVSRELLIEIVAELEELHSLLEERARRLRAAAALLREIESIMDRAVTPPADSAEEPVSRPAETKRDWPCGYPQ